MITVIDSGVANLASVMAALGRIGADADVTLDAAKIRAASHVILPGVGAAPPAMQQLERRGLVDVIRKLTQPVLGICLGMQLLFTATEEGAQDGRLVPCLNVIPGELKLLKASANLPVPHMGWNHLQPVKPDHALLRGIAAGSYVYFVHSFAVPVGDITVAATDYGQNFTSVASQGNFMGCQFHPERSGEVGSHILKNFVEM